MIIPEINSFWSLRNCPRRFWFFCLTRITFLSLPTFLLYLFLPHLLDFKNLLPCLPFAVYWLIFRRSFLTDFLDVLAISVLLVRLFTLLIGILLLSDPVCVELLIGLVVWFELFRLVAKTGLHLLGQAVNCPSSAFLLNEWRVVVVLVLLTETNFYLLSLFIFCIHIALQRVHRLNAILRN